MVKILWADDEIDILKPHLLFLEEKGYDVKTANNGQDAMDLFKEDDFDLVFLDENMPGLSGLETLVELKNLREEVPVIMITKSEEEHIMEEAIGGKIADYLIKPVNPNQILLSIKKNIDNRRIISEKTTQNYQQEFRKLSMRLMEDLDAESWKQVYRDLVYWELELARSDNSGMDEVLQMQKLEANRQFCSFIEDEYINWINAPNDSAPILSHTMFKEKVLPHVNAHPSVFFVVIDNLRFDQWKTLQTLLMTNYKVEEEDLYYAILPTATQFARNAMFAGLMPSDIEKRHPDLWRNEDDEGGKNMYEEQLLKAQLSRYGQNIKCSYNKITNLNAGKKLADNLQNLAQNKLNVIVYNFVDMLSHARTDMEVIRELADDEAAYRSLTQSWFAHSPLLEIFNKIAEMKIPVVLSTDHGTVRVKDPIKVIGDRNTSTNLRYKQGKNLRYDAGDVFSIQDPDKGHLPRINVSTRYIFAKNDRFFAYPNNYNYYVNFYRNTFQHGGISLEEVLVPSILLLPK